MKPILSMLGDGQGNTSLMRVAVLLVIVAVIASKFYNAHLTGLPVAWDEKDFALIGGSLLSKLVQNSQEKAANAAELQTTTTTAA